ncbi:MAG: hypothetical protein KF760_22105 [Candidatus Eremiobacteraeota bacterium]|nr:hypothetical protein [Candidatus Eremiobacteraeota bacterium]MCW5872025.1 hypothetical protein [Candidatus Eremiobacteraeota bacterium]
MFARLLKLFRVRQGPSEVPPPPNLVPLPPYDPPDDPKAREVVLQLEQHILPELEKAQNHVGMDKADKWLFIETLLVNPELVLGLLHDPFVRQNRRLISSLLDMALANPHFRDQRSPYWDYLAAAYALEILPSGPHQQGICKAAQDWILPELRRRVRGVGESDFGDLLRRWLRRPGETQIILTGTGGRGQKLTQLVILGLADHNNWSPDMSVSEKFMRAFPIQPKDLNWSMCRHCNQFHNSASMKSASRCWGCWSG